MHKVLCYPPAHLCLVVTFSTICAVSVGWETLYNLWDDRNMWDYSMNWQLPSGLVWSQSQTQPSGLRLLILLCSYQSLWVLNSLNLRQPVSRTEYCAHRRFVLWSVPTSVVIIAEEHPLESKRCKSLMKFCSLEDQSLINIYIAILKPLGSVHSNIVFQTRGRN